MCIPFNPNPNHPVGRLRGRVVERKSGKPVADAAIKLQAVDSTAGLGAHIRQPGRAASDGRFEFPSVLAGEYYIFASAPGYVSRSNLIPRWSGSGIPRHLRAEPEVLDSHLAKVRVDAHGTVITELQLEIEGSVSGTVSWQDGSASPFHDLSFLYIREDRRFQRYTPLMEEDAKLYWHRENFTDEAGGFHVGGIHTGSYIVSAIGLSASGSFLQEALDGRTAARIEVVNGRTVKNVHLVMPMCKPPGHAPRFAERAAISRIRGLKQRMEDVRRLMQSDGDTR